MKCTYDNSSSYVSTSLIVICMGNYLICVFITGMIKELSRHTSCDISCKSQLPVLFHSITPANSYTHKLSMHRGITRLSTDFLEQVLLTM